MTKINKITTFFAALALGLLAQSGVAFAATNISSCNSVTLNGYVAPKNSPSTVWFEWSTNTSDISNGSATKTPTKTFTTNSYFSQQVTGLNERTTYYYRTASRNAVGTVYGNVTSFVTASCGGSDNGDDDNNDNDNNKSSVSTYSATGVDQSSATLKGYINPNGTSGTEYWFEWGTSSSNLSRTTSRVSTNSSRDASSYISGLSSNTTYYFRIVGNNNAGTTYGSIKSFRTDSNNDYNDDDNNNDDQEVSVSTKTASNVGYDSATLNGYVDTNGSSYTTRWFEWGRTSSNLSNTTSQSNISGSGNVSSYVSGLSNNTTYYYRVVARNSNGTVYGSRYSFTTGSNNTCTNCDERNDGVAPTAITMLATNVESTSATLNSLVLQSGNIQSSAWFEWGTTQSLGRRTNTKSIGSAPSVRHAEDIYGLTSGATYYFRIVSENEVGRNYGTINSFVAKAPVYIYKPAPAPVKKPIVVVKKAVAPVVANKTVTVVEHAEGVSSLIMLTITGEDDTIAKGVGETYTVTWRNLSNQDLTNVVLRVIVPESLTFESADDGTYSKPDGILTILIGNLDAGEEGEMSLVLKGANTLNMNDLVVTTANIVYTDEYSVQGDALAYTTQRTITGTSVLGAGVGTVGGISLALIGWLVLIILLIILAIVIHNLYTRLRNSN